MARTRYSTEAAVERYCLKCSKQFTAEGRYIRLCDACKHKNQKLNGYRSGKCGGRVNKKGFQS